MKSMKSQNGPAAAAAAMTNSMALSVSLSTTHRQTCELKT